MSNSSMNYVMTLLQNYRATKRKIEQLRYELEHPARVTPDEMIEAMNFAKGDGEGRPSGSISNKTLYIAMNFQSAADEANAALAHDLVSRLVPLEQEINRLEHYVHFWSRGRPRSFDSPTSRGTHGSRSALKPKSQQERCIRSAIKRSKSWRKCMR